MEPKRAQPPFLSKSSCQETPSMGKTIFDFMNFKMEGNLLLVSSYRGVNVVHTEH